MLKMLIMLTFSHFFNIPPRPAPHRPSRHRRSDCPTSAGYADVEDQIVAAKRKSPFGEETGFFHLGEPSDREDTNLRLPACLLPASHPKAFNTDFQGFRRMEHRFLPSLEHPLLRLYLPSPRLFAFS
jgi:hypothetical protein